MILNGIGQMFGAVGDVVGAPFKLLNGLVSTAAGVATLPFRLVGGLFGGGSPAAMSGAQAGMMPFLP